jgi:hypothetical protein
VKKIQRILWLTLGLLVGSALAMSLTSLASGDGPDAVPRVLPYDGYLALEGDAYQGTVDLQITLTDADGQERWTEQHSGVQVDGGKFGLLIGAVQGEVPAWLFEATGVYLQLAVRASGQEQFVALEGQRRLTPAAFAWWSAQGDHYKARGTVTALREANFEGAFSTGALALVDVEEMSMQGALYLPTGDQGGLEAPGASLRVSQAGYLDLSADSGSTLTVGQLVMDPRGLTLTSSAAVPSLEVTQLWLSGKETSGSLLTLYNLDGVIHEDDEGSTTAGVSYSGQGFCAITGASSSRGNSTCRVNRGDGVSYAFADQSRHNFGQTYCHMHCITWGAPEP